MTGGEGRTKGTLWACPRCGREFAKRNQWHSCLAYDVDGHFAGKDPRLREIFDLLVAKMEEFGPLRFDAVRRTINLIARHHLGGVEVQKKALRLGFLHDEPLESERFVRVARLGPHRVGHTVKLHSVDDVDDELLGWLKKAYELQS
jgi:hypothetical protein